MAQLLVIGGPNGAGKTTFVRQYLSSYPGPFVSADDVAATLAASSTDAGPMATGRKFFSIVEELITNRQDFALESTLSGRSLIRLLQDIQARGYEIKLVYIHIASVEQSLARVWQRVQNGGHDVPTPDVIRRYARCGRNFWDYYRLAAKEWALFDNTSGNYLELAFGRREDYTVLQENRFASFLRSIGVTS